MQAYLLMVKLTAKTMLKLTEALAGSFGSSCNAMTCTQPGTTKTVTSLLRDVGMIRIITKNF